MRRAVARPVSWSRKRFRPSMPTGPMMSGGLPAAISGLEDAAREGVVHDLDGDVGLVLSGDLVVTSLIQACSGPGGAAGWVPAPRPMNQRTTTPPLGPGPAAIGAGAVIRDVCSGSGWGYWPESGPVVGPTVVADWVSRVPTAGAGHRGGRPLRGRSRGLRWGSNECVCGYNLLLR